MPVRRGERITMRVLDSVAALMDMRKLILAKGLVRSPWLVVMDEPTNHLDLPSVECLEATLADFPGALLLVSHDHEFLDRTVDAGWELSEGRLEVHARDR